MFTVDEVLKLRYPKLYRNSLLGPSTKIVLRKLLRENDLADFGRRYPHLQGIDFVEQILEELQFSYLVSDRDRENIPISGRVVIIANHPIGTLDGLALLKLVNEIRSDVRIVANDLLMFIRPLHPCLLPVNNMEGVTLRRDLRNIEQALAQEEAVIIFPAGEVSRLRLDGIKDGKWRKGFLRLATRTRSPILPVHISGHNSPFFYSTSLALKSLSSPMLISEMFRQENKQICFRVGKIIPFSSYCGLPLRQKERIRLLKKHVYRLGRGKPPVFLTESAVAAPERRHELKKDLQQAELLGQTPDGKRILLYDSRGVSPVLREIGRLREMTFRMVGEGSGRRRDVDRYDSYYRHLILWDEEDLEIVGAYRFTDARKTIEEKGVNGLYSHSLFNVEPDKHTFLEKGLELGRSFVQKQYWGKRSLDYLWYGIGAFLAGNPDYRFLFGPVSISGTIPPLARDLLITFYQLYFGSPEAPLCSRNPFSFSHSRDELADQFVSTDYKTDFKRLKNMLSNLGTSVPTLYKQYSELCTPGGVSFLDFNVDPDFNYCIDGLVVVDLTRLKEKKRKRYMEGNNQVKPF